MYIATFQEPLSYYFCHHPITHFTICSTADVHTRTVQLGVRVRGSLDYFKECRVFDSFTKGGLVHIALHRNVDP